MIYDILGCGSPPDEIYYVVRRLEKFFLKGYLSKNRWGPYPQRFKNIREAVQILKSHQKNLKLKVRTKDIPYGFYYMFREGV